MKSSPPRSVQAPISPRTLNPELERIAQRLAEAPLEASGHLYHPLPFPEFETLDTSATTASAYRKWTLIFRALGSRPLDGARVLDVGANAGYYAFSLAKVGAVVDAFEPDLRYSRIGIEVTRATGLHVLWHEKALGAPDLHQKTYDIALLLSVFQWMSSGNERLEEATSLLRLITSSSRVVFFELGCNSGKSAIQTSEPALRWIWRLLTQAGGGKQVAYLGSTTAWGKGSTRHLLACSGESVALSPPQWLISRTLRLLYGG